MFHAGGHKGVGGRGRSSGLSRHHGHFLAELDWRRPLRCGVVFCTLCCILVVLGAILTWLGVHDVLGESAPITGPILMSVGVLLMVLASRQFYLTHARKKAHDKALQAKAQSQTTLGARTDDDECDVIDPEANLAPNKEDIESEDVVSPDDGCDKSPLNSKDRFYDVISTSGHRQNNMSNYLGTPVQRAYYSLAMMALRDTGPASKEGNTLVGDLNATSSNHQLVLGGGRDIDAVGADSSQNTANYSSAHSVGPGHAAELQVLSEKSGAIGGTHSPSSSVTTAGGQVDPTPKIFPADYLTPQSRKNPTGAGINSLPNSIAFMMIRTLELQETI